MTANQPNRDPQQRGRTDASNERGNKQNLVKFDMLTTVISLICLAVVLGFVGNTAQDYWKQGQHARAVWWAGATALIAVIGIMATVLPMAYKADSEAQAAKADDDPIKEARDLLRAQTADTMRPFVSVIYAKGTFEIGKPVGMELRFKNTGKSPAESAEIYLVFEKILTTQRIQRDYMTRPEFKNPSVGTIGTVDPVIISKTGHEWTLDELMQVTTDRTHKIVAHGLVRYSSGSIFPAGFDETRFCYEFDPESGEMAVCRKNTLPENEGQ